MIRGHTLQEVVDAGHAPSVQWLRKRLNRGEIPGYTVGRKGRGGAHHDWRMTDADIEAFVASRRTTAVTVTKPAATSLNLTAASARRLKVAQ